jgi:NIPSNAP
VFQLRIYTLRSAEALDRYAAIHWARHIGSLEAFGVETRGIWTSRDAGENRLFALVSYENGADPARVETEYMAGSVFAEDMAGFDPHDIVDVTSVLLAATTSSPIR